MLLPVWAQANHTPGLTHTRKKANVARKWVGVPPESEFAEHSILSQRNLGVRKSRRSWMRCTLLHAE